MPAASPFTYAPVSLNGLAASDGGKTRSQSALYGTIYFTGNYGSYQVGLAQRISWQGQTGNTPVRGIGEPYSENKPGDLYFTFTMSNFSIRTQRIMDAFASLYATSSPGSGQYYSSGGLTNIDFRQISFDLMMGFSYGPPSISPLYESSAEYLTGCWIQTWTAEWSDPNSLRLEGVTGWAMGYDYITNSGNAWQAGNIANINGASLPGN